MMEQEYKADRKNTVQKLTMALFMAVILFALVWAAGADECFAQADWYRYQNSDENNGVTSVELPPSYNEAALKWGRQMVAGYTTSFTPPLIIDGYVYTASNKRVYKINKDTGDVVASSTDMQINVSYAMHPMTYCEEKDLLFIPLLNGRVQCIKASDLSLKWISKTYTGTQALSPIAYKDGMVYTGIWSNETGDGVYFGLNADTGKTVWEFRPSEQKLETVARALPDFPKPTGASRPDNFYTYTALIRVKPAEGYSFNTDSYGKYWLYHGTDKVVPEGARESDLVQSVVNGYGAGIDVNDDGTATIRVRYDYYNGQFTQAGNEDQVSSIVITGLDAPETGNTLDQAVETESPVTVEGIEWKTGDVPHGFYWAGPYAGDDYLVFGSDDGQNNTFGDANSSTYTETSILYSVDRRTGELIDKVEGCRGDIRSTVVYHDGYIYFTSKGGRIYKVKINSDGTFNKDKLSYYTTDGLMTASPVIYNGRIYVGVSGTGGQFNADGGHMFAVLRDDEMLTGSYSVNDPEAYSGSLIYTTQVAGYPQASPLLSTGGSDGKVRLYFTFNAFPGGIYYLEDSPSSTASNHADAALLFRPELEMQQYCISPIAADSEGTLYIKNDSGYLMAVAVNKAYLPTLDPDNNVYGIKVTYHDEELEWNQPFASSTLNYRLIAPNGAESVDVELDVPSGMTALINGDDYSGGKYNIPISEDASATTVTVKRNVLGKLYVRTYTLNLSAANNNANLAGIALTDSNTAPRIVDSGEYHANDLAYGYDPVFDAGTTKYVSRSYTGTNKFVNIWVKPEDAKATVKCYPVDSVGNILSYTNEDGTIPDKGSNGNIRFPVYWIKGKISAEVRIEVTPPSGKEEAKKTYNVELVRSEDHLDIGNEPLTLSISSATLYTRGGERTLSVTASYGEKDVTGDCTWYSSRPDIVTVDADGNVAAQDKVGSAVVWASYGFQDTEDRPLVITVKKPECDPPKASIDSGRYGSSISVVLSADTPNSEIYYNIGEGNTAVSKPDKNSTKYTGPISLGEDGAYKKYKIRAVAIKDGFYTSTSTDLDYTIDLREKINEAEISGLDQPEEGKAFDTDIAVSDAVKCESVSWFKLADGEEQAAGAAVEAGMDYRAKIVLASADESSKIVTGSTLIKMGGRYLDVEYGANGKITASADYIVSGRPIDVISLTGIKAPYGGIGFDNTVYSTTQGIKIVKAEWKTADGETSPEEAAFNTKYRFDITTGPEDGFDMAESVNALVNRDGQKEEAEIVKNSDGTYTVTVYYTTAKLKVDALSGPAVSVSPETVLELDNGTAIGDIISAVKENAVVSVKTEDGSNTVIPKENIYWDEEAITDVYDPNAINASEFSVQGRITLPEELDANGSTLTVSVNVKIRQGVVQVPVITPGPGTYGAEQTVTFASPTAGAAVMFTRSDMDGQFTYEEPIILSGTSGKKVSYIFKMFAMVNGIRSETVMYTIVIDRTPEAADASKNSKDSITPNEVAAAAALENKKAGKVAASKVTVTGNAAKGTLTLRFPKVSGTKNYRIEYRKAGSKTWYYIWSKGKTAAAVKGLKKGAMYEFRIATYRITDGFWQRGPWSASIYEYMMTTSTSLKAGKKSFTATLKKVKKASGYKIRYSLKKNMSSAKTKTLKGASKTKAKISKLKSGKVYYVQVCPYRKSGGKTYVGIWSSKKKVKVQ